IEERVVLLRRRRVTGGRGRGELRDILHSPGLGQLQLGGRDVPVGIEGGQPARLALGRDTHQVSFFEVRDDLVRRRAGAGGGGSGDGAAGSACCSASGCGAAGSRSSTTGAADSAGAAGRRVRICASNRLVSSWRRAIAARNASPGDCTGGRSAAVTACWSRSRLRRSWGP